MRKPKSIIGTYAPEIQKEKILKCEKWNWKRWPIGEFQK